jgi:hypothetical protein
MVRNCWTCISMPAKVLDRVHFSSQNDITVDNNNLNNPEDSADDNEDASYELGMVDTNQNGFLTLDEDQNDNTTQLEAIINEQLIKDAAIGPGEFENGTGNEAAYERDLKRE